MYRSALASGLLTLWSTLTNWQTIVKPLDGIFWKNWDSCWWNVVLADVWVLILLIYCKAVKKGLRFAIFFFLSEVSCLQLKASYYSKILSPSLIFTWTAVTNNTFEMCKNASYCCARKYETWRCKTKICDKIIIY